MAIEFGLRVEYTHEFMAKKVGGIDNLAFTTCETSKIKLK